MIGSLPALVMAGVLGGAVVAWTLTAGANPVMAAVAAGSSVALMGQAAAAAPVTAKALMVLGGATGLGVWMRGGLAAHPAARVAASILGGFGLIAGATGSVVLAGSLGMALGPGLIAVGLAGGLAGGYGGMQLAGCASKGIGVLVDRALAPKRLEAMNQEQLRASVADLRDGLKPRTSTVVEESQGKVVIGGVKLRRREVRS